MLFLINVHKNRFITRGQAAGKYPSERLKSLIYGNANPAYENALRGDTGSTKVCYTRVFRCILQS